MDNCICPRIRGRADHHTFACFLFAICGDERWKVRYWNNYNADQGDF